MQFHNHGVNAVGNSDEEESDSENEDGENIPVELVHWPPQLFVNSAYVMMCIKLLNATL